MQLDGDTVVALSAAGVTVLIDARRRPAAGDRLLGS